ncbi:uracil permease [Gracilibacillus boraciitolerans JCM 21714]|uniref:Uracil permease n=1 Tax=Gracilibacillus boraciitolerans JCM 21714 TaxID=1298598 RepID=W4VG18_9BACI|nr:uracil permease [Gracilibacillus boraciitolerans JCM 21714]
MLITKGQIPAYLGSSFAFIAPIISAMAIGGAGGVMIGSFLAGLVYGVLSLLIGTFGTGWIIKVLPPVVVGPIIIVIGLGLAPTAIDMAMNVDGGEYSAIHFSSAIVTLLITVIGSLLFRGFFGLIPILIGIMGGYIYSLIVTVSSGEKIIDTSGIQAVWHNIINSSSIGEVIQSIFLVPEFVIPFVNYNPAEVFSWSIIWMMVPVAVVTVQNILETRWCYQKLQVKISLGSQGYIALF